MVSFTVCIACVDKHVARMERLLHSFEKYTVKPDKVIVSMSPNNLTLDLTEEKKRLEKAFPFLTCIVQDKVTTMGQNINIVFEHVETDYAVIWGADDFFHPQYFEVLSHVINKHNPNMIAHFWDDELTKRVHFNPELAYNFDVFDKIELDKMTIYTDFYLMTIGDGRGSTVNRFCEMSLGFLPYFHYGMQTFKTHIIKENKYKVGPEYDYRSDTLFITEMYQKYGNACVVAENLIQYMPSWTYSTQDEIDRAVKKRNEMR